MVIDNDEMKKLGSMLFSQIEKLCDDTVLNDSGKLNNLIASGKELSELIPGQTHVKFFVLNF